MAPSYFTGSILSSWFKSSSACLAFQCSPPQEPWCILQEGLCLLQCWPLGFLLSLFYPYSHYFWMKDLPASSPLCCFKRSLEIPIFSLKSLLINSNPNLFFLSLSFCSIYQSYLCIALFSHFHPHVIFNILIKLQMAPKQEWLSPKSLPALTFYNSSLYLLQCLVQIIPLIKTGWQYVDWTLLHSWGAQSLLTTSGPWNGQRGAYLWLFPFCSVQDVRCHLECDLMQHFPIGKDEFSAF